MKFLLFLLGVIFFFIFFLFSKIGGIEGFFISNIYIQAHIYIFISIFFIITLSLHNFLKDNKQEPEQQQEKEPLFSTQDIGVFIKRLFSQYIYYIALSLFYISVYFVLRSLYGSLSVDIFFLALNTLVLFLYFIEHKFEVFQDFIRVNLILGSLYYIGHHILYLAWFLGDISGIDFVNMLSIFILFCIVFYTPNTKKYKQIISHYFIAFTFLEIGVVLEYIFNTEILLFTITSWILGFLFLLFTDFIRDYTTIKRSYIRQWGVIFLWLFTLMSLYFLSRETIVSFILILLLSGASYILYLFHQRFQNYLALWFSSLALSGVLYGIYNFLMPTLSEKYYMYIIFFSMGIVFLWIDSYMPRKYVYDKYFYHVYSLLVNVLWVFCFFFFTDFSILWVGVLLFVESIYLFISYFTLKKIV